MMISGGHEAGLLKDDAVSGMMGGLGVSREEGWDRIESSMTIWVSAPNGCVSFRSCALMQLGLPRQADDEYYIRDYDLLVSRYISVPRSYEPFNPGTLAAGIMRGMLDSAGFPARVTAHFVTHKDRQRPITTFMIKLEPSVMQRQAYLEAAKKG
ncbi:hypothetical protein Vretifemale_16765 [Volvox reticuliferus]|uniref:Trafficking protein particle complex subunit n=1 Tax=Volvox reticuliferus TaxID=1737510 RepID=A0A8J4FXZ9_9CHLO|nr:hypothetical protein Vretifemale_16765 [Volvox reticuliferus]